MELPKSIVEEKISKFIEKSKKLGLKITPQRIAIYKELAKTDEHPSTETIHKNIKKHYPNISLTTVYRTLETFENIGIISVVNLLYNAARYDANMKPHHHIVCIKCKRIEDVYDESINYSKLTANINNYEIRGYSVLFNGLCKECAE